MAGEPAREVGAAWRQSHLPAGGGAVRLCSPSLEGPQRLPLLPPTPEGSQLLTFAKSRAGRDRGVPCHAEFQMELRLLNGF